MILLLALAVTLFVAFLRGGSLRSLADFHLEWGWLAGLALAIQIVAVYGATSDSYLYLQRGALIVSGLLLLPSEETALWALSDIFIIPPPFPVASAFSLGDILVAGGAFIFLQRAMVSPHPRSSEPRPS
jgi:zinc transporter ZupT